MFGLLEDAFDIVTSPIRNTVDILEGLSEGELRTHAISQLGASAIAGLEAYEIIELLAESMADDE